MFFGMFGSIFLLAQFFQTVQGYSPFGSGLRILPWTAMPIFVAPIAGALSDRIGGRPLMALGLALQAIGLGWIAAIGSATTPYARLRRAVRASPGIGMALFFAPVANVVLSSVRPEEEGQASGANNAIRELGGVFGVAVLASIFAHYGGYGSGAGVRRRAEPGDLGRRGGRRARRGRRARDPAPQAAAEVGASRALHEAPGRSYRDSLSRAVPAQSGRVVAAMARPVPLDQTPRLAPELSVVVTVFNEAGSLEELYRRDGRRARRAATSS